MKNLSYHKKQVRTHRMRNIHEQAMTRVDEIGQKVLAHSQERWDGMLHDLELQRCNLERKQRERIPLPMRTFMAAVRTIALTDIF